MSLSSERTVNVYYNFSEYDLTALAFEKESTENSWGDQVGLTVFDDEDVVLETTIRVDCSEEGSFENFPGFTLPYGLVATRFRFKF